MELVSEHAQHESMIIFFVGSMTIRRKYLIT